MSIQTEVLLLLAARDSTPQIIRAFTRGLNDVSGAGQRASNAMAAQARATNLLSIANQQAANATDAVALAQDRLAKASTSGMAAAQLAVNRAQTQLAIAKQGVKDMEAQVEKSSAAMQGSTGFGGIALAVAGIGLAMSHAIEVSNKFDQAISDAVAHSSQNLQQVAQDQQSILGITPGGQTRLTPQQYAAAEYTLRTTYPTANAQQFTNIMKTAGMQAQATPDQLNNLLGADLALSKAYGTSLDQFGKIADLVEQATSRSMAPPLQFAQGISTFGKYAAEVGVDQASALGAFAEGTIGNQRYRFDAQDFLRFMESVTNPNKAAMETVKKLGLQADFGANAFRNRGYAGVLSDIQNAIVGPNISAGTTQQLIHQLFPNQAAMQAALGQFGSQFNPTMATIQNIATQNQGSVARVNAISQKGPQAALDDLASMFQTREIEIGNTLKTLDSGFAAAGKAAFAFTDKVGEALGYTGNALDQFINSIKTGNLNNFLTGAGDVLGHFFVNALSGQQFSEAWKNAQGQSAQDMARRAASQSGFNGILDTVRIMQAIPGFAAAANAIGPLSLAGAANIAPPAAPRVAPVPQPYDPNNALNTSVARHQASQAAQARADAARAARAAAAVAGPAAKYTGITNAQQAALTAASPAFVSGAFGSVSGGANAASIYGAVNAFANYATRTVASQIAAQQAMLNAANQNAIAADRQFKASQLFHDSVPQQEAALKADVQARLNLIMLQAKTGTLPKGTNLQDAILGLTDYQQQAQDAINNTLRQQLDVQRKDLQDRITIDQLKGVNAQMDINRLINFDTLNAGMLGMTKTGIALEKLQLDVKQDRTNPKATGPVLIRTPLQGLGDIHTGFMSTTARLGGAAGEGQAQQQIRALQQANAHLQSEVTSLQEINRQLRSADNKYEAQIRLLTEIADGIGQGKGGSGGEKGGGISRVTKRGRAS